MCAQFMLNTSRNLFLIKKIAGKSTEACTICSCFKLVWTYDDNSFLFFSNGTPRTFLFVNIYQTISIYIFQQELLDFLS